MAQGQLPAADGSNGKVVLFTTCFTNYNNPALGRDIVEVFERNRIRVVCPPRTCCGMPALVDADGSQNVSLMPISARWVIVRSVCAYESVRSSETSSVYARDSRRRSPT